MESINVVDLHIHPLVKVSKRIFDSCSNNILDDVVGVYADNLLGIQGYSCSKKMQLPITEHFIQWANVQRKMAKTTLSTWVTPEQLPLFRDFIPKNNNNIFDELKLTVCIIYHNSFYESDKNDLIILYLKLAKESLFSSKEFSLRDKNVFSRLMEAMTKPMLLREYEIHSLMKAMHKHFETARELWEYQKNEQYQTKGKYLHYAHHIFGKLNKEYGIHISLSKEAENIIIAFEGELQKFENELITAVKVAANTLPFSAGSIELDEFSLIGLTKMNIEERKIVSSGKSAVSDIHKESKTGQISKSETFLNRLEGAAKAIIERGEKVTGKNVATQLSITPPAINDSLNRYHDYIVKLMAQYSTQWSLLRRHFRPIQNILNSVP